MIICSRCRNRNPDTAKNCRFCQFPLVPPVTKDPKTAVITKATPGPVTPEVLDTDTAPESTPPKPLLPEPRPITQEPARVTPTVPPLDRTVRTPDAPRLSPDADTSDPSQRPNARTSGASGAIVTPPFVAPRIVTPPIVTPPVVTPPVLPPPVVTPPIVTPPVGVRPGVPTPAPSSALAWILAAALGMGGFTGGYFVGAHNASVAGSGQINAQATDELTRDRAQIQTDSQSIAARDTQILDLRQQLAQMKALTDQSSQADAAARAKDAAKDAKLRTVQEQLSAEQAQSANSAKERQAALEQLQNASNSASERARQAEAKLAATVAEVNSLRSKTANGPVRVAAQKSGQITWTGNVDGKKTIEINDSGPTGGGTFSGALPGIPVQVRPVDPNIVTIKTAPSTGRGNSWNHLKFEVKGHGMVNATIIWTAEASGG